jgi:hypothetical protein
LDRGDLLTNDGRLRKGWRRLHRVLHDATEDHLIITTGQSGEDRYFTMVRSFQRSAFPGADYWRRIRVKVKFFLEQGEVQGWDPVCRLMPQQGDGAPPFTWPPKPADVPVSDLKPMNPMDTGYRHHGAILWSASAGRGFGSRQAILAQVTLGFRIKAATEGRLQLRSIKLYE